MKKILLCMVLAGLMMPVMAQEKRQMSDKQMKTLSVIKSTDSGLPVSDMLPVNPTRFLIEVDEWFSIGEAVTYDLQTQGAVYPMAKLHDDKSFIGAIWTNNNAPIFPGNPDGNNRSVAYSFSTDGGKTWSWDKEEGREMRLGGIPVYWGSYAQWGPNGEAVMARSFFKHEFNGIQIEDGIVLFTRETRGEGDWTITPVPYPDDANPLFFYAWGAMATSGEQNQYIHIMTPMSTRDLPAQQYHGYNEPVLYFRTQDGKTWEVEGQVVPEMVGQEWGRDSNFSDGFSFASQGNTIACSFISIGSHGFVLRSLDNGDTWESIKFFDSPIQGHLTPEEYGDSVYVPNVGCLALDNNGKIHVAFSMICAKNGDAPGGYSYWPWAWAQFLSYWNEDMPMMNGDEEYNIRVIPPLLMGFPRYDGDYFDWDQSTDDQLYVKSTIPKWPVIGYFTPVMDDHKYTFLDDAQEWAGSSYRQAGMFSFPQMAFDVNNKLHLVYLGLLDGKGEDDRWFRHPFYTTYSNDESKTWTQTEYFISDLDYIDKEFAYPVLAGLGNDKMYLMTMVDDHAGLHIPAGQGAPSDHGPMTNYFTGISLAPVPTTSIPEIEKTSIAMTLIPNPAVSGQTKVIFEGKGNITVYNMLGQTVYHAENVVREKEISLSNLTTGVYFVTVRSGNAMATQKLVVK